MQTSLFALHSHDKGGEPCSVTATSLNHLNGWGIPIQLHGLQIEVGYCLCSKATELFGAVR
jgi:hypothetical protein